MATPGRPALAILTRDPQPGRAKTRLAAAIGDEAAAAIARAILRDTVQALTPPGAPWHCAIFVEPAAAAGHVTALTGQTDVRPQAAGDIGARMAAAAAALFADGFTPVVLVGSDIPALSAGHIAEALEASRRAGAVFGPAADGGYYLLALHRLRSDHEERLLRDPIPWGSDGVLSTSEALATRLGLRTLRVRVEWDLDTAADLASLRARAARDPAAAGPRLHAVLADLPVVNASGGEETR